jgi:hypothetical protein
MTQAFTPQGYGVLPGGSTAVLGQFGPPGMQFRPDMNMTGMMPMGQFAPQREIDPGMMQFHTSQPSQGAWMQYPGMPAPHEAAMPGLSGFASHAMAGQAMMPQYSYFPLMTGMPIQAGVAQGGMLEARRGEAGVDMFGRLLPGGNSASGALRHLQTKPADLKYSH